MNEKSAVSDFQDAFTDMTLAAPMISTPPATPRTVERTVSAPSASPVNLQNTINVQVDGETVARTVERRLISQRQLAGGY